MQLAALVSSRCQARHADAANTEHSRRERRFVQSAPHGGDQSSLHPDMFVVEMQPK